MDHKADAQLWAEDGVDLLPGLDPMLWTSPAWKMKPRDLRIGWSDEQRHHLPWIVNIGRFLILPGVNVKTG